MLLARRRKIPQEDITYFLSELSILLESGLSLKEALAFTKHEDMPPLLSKFVNSVQTSVQQGRGLAAALAAHPQYVQPFLVELLSQAERKQHLQSTLAEIVRFRETNDVAEINMDGRIKVAMAYPLTLLATALVVLVVMMLYVIPKFKLLLDDMGAELPALTMLLFDMSNIVLEWGWVSIPVLALLFVPIRKDSHTNRYINTFDYLREWLAFNFPGFDNIYHAFEIIRCLRTWEFMLAQNKSIDKVLDASASMVQSTLYAGALRQMRAAIISSTPIADALTQQSLFPYKVKQALLIAIRGGNSRGLLAKLADLYIQQALLKFDRNIRLFTLLSNQVIGFIIGIIVIALYLPIFQMAKMS